MNRVGLHKSEEVGVGMRYLTHKRETQTADDSAAIGGQRHSVVAAAAAVVAASDSRRIIVEQIRRQ